MKAAVLNKYGSPQELRIKDIPKPQIAEGQILIRNFASSVNPVDTQVRRGRLRMASGIFGTSVIGSDFCGKVIESKSSKFNVGDDVFGFVTATTGHAYAEYVAVDEKEAALKPANLNYAESSSLPLVACTAWQALVKLGNIKKGYHVLINGCTGGVGSAAVQIAKSFGSIVTGTCSEKHMDTARELGCDHLLNYKSDTIPQDKRYNLIFDTAGKLMLSDVEESLTDDGLLIVTIPVMKNIKTIFSSSLELLKKRMKLIVLKPDQETLSNIKRLIEEGNLRPSIAKAFPIEAISQAHEMLEKESFAGKLVVEIYKIEA